MSRRYGNQPANKLNQPTEPEFVPKPLSKEQLRQWESIFNLISHFTKSHNKQTVTTSFNKLKRFCQTKKKYSTFLANKLYFLQRRKCREYLKWTFSNLQSNRINYYPTNMDGGSERRYNIKSVDLILLRLKYNFLNMRYNHRH